MDDQPWWILKLGLLLVLAMLGFQLALSQI
jgi:hypothetical protein